MSRPAAAAAGKAKRQPALQLFRHTLLCSKLPLLSSTDYLRRVEYDWKFVHVFLLCEFLLALTVSVFNMLRSSLRGSGSRLFGGSCCPRRSPHMIGASRQDSLVPACSSRSSLYLSRVGKRCYAVAAEDTNKGVVCESKVKRTQ